MSIPRLSPAAYRRITLTALILLAIIIVTGAAVRLTGSGLGCPDWPTCARGRYVAPDQFHRRVEELNRGFTGFVSVAVIAAVLGSLRRVPRRSDLCRLSFALVAGLLGQVVLGGVTVLFKLNPWIVAAHFLVSMLLVWDAVVLHHRAGMPDIPDILDIPRPARRDGGAEVRWATRLLVGAAAIVLVTGTLVTGSGPHGGDEHVTRLPFFVPDVARFHGSAELLLLALTLLVSWMARQGSSTGALRRALTTLLAVEVAQGVVGYTQYFTGVPELLVAIHVTGAVAVWVAVLEVALTANADTAVNETARRVALSR